MSFGPFGPMSRHRVTVTKLPADQLPPKHSLLAAKPDAPPASQFARPSEFQGDKVNRACHFRWQSLPVLMLERWLEAGKSQPLPKYMRTASTESRTWSRNGASRVTWLPVSKTPGNSASSTISKLRGLRFSDRSPSL